jgi:photosystem II stability/assembly factor-like uncharacterized protein
MALSFVGLGSDNVTSSDGFKWLGWRSLVTPGGVGVNSTCIVVGGGASTPVAARSTDGHTFVFSTVANPHSSDSPFITSLGMNDAFGVAVGNRPGSSPGDQAELWTSADDGLTWTDVPQPSFLSGVGVVAFGDVYCDNILTIVYYRIGFGGFNAPPYTQGAMTTTNGSTWAASIAPAHFIQKIVKAGSKYYAWAVADDGTVSLGTSTDAVNWTYQAQPLNNTFGFFNFAATSSLIAFMGQNGAGTAGFIETSSDGGATWHSATLDPSITEVDSMAFNAGVWAGTGVVTDTNFNTWNVAITSVNGGTSWVLGNQIGQFTCAEMVLYNVVVNTSSVVLFVYDNCCHLFTSFDLGLTWALSFQNVVTLDDNFTDLSMAIADSDYTTTMSYDVDFSPSLGNFTSQGQICVSKNSGLTGTWTFINPDPARNPPNDPNNFVEYQSGAITKGAQTIIVLPTSVMASGIRTDAGFIRISSDGGTTWADTAISLGARQWEYACIAKGGQTMYALSTHSPGVSKSQDGGAIWIDLPTSPNILANMGESGGRIRCSNDGSIAIVAINTHGSGASNQIWLTKDGGNTWSQPVILTNTSNNIDASLSSDGKVMMALDAADNQGSIIIRYSTNSGSTWNSHDLTSLLSADNPGACNVSPDGSIMLVGFAASISLPQGGHVAAISIDGGATWTVSDIPSRFSNPVVAAFVTPSVSPFIPPKGGYIIERLDNRLWPTVENAWCVDCGFTLARPKPPADLTISSATGAGIPTGITLLVGGQGYSAATTAQLIDGNGLGPGTGASVGLTITGGVITGVMITGGTGYIYPNLVINDPENTGSGASAMVTLDNSATFTASAGVFSAGNIGNVIRAGYGVAVITSIVGPQQAIANILSPVVQVQPDDPAPGTVQTQVNGTWTMTEPITQFYLPQLIGFTITGLADGQIIQPTVVPANGIVTLAKPASAIIVGLAFQAQLQSTYLDAGEPTVQGQRKKIAAVSVRVEQSAAFQVGANQPDGSVQSPQQLAPQWQNMVDAPTHAVAPFNAPYLPLFTGDVRVPIPGGFNTRGQVAVQQLNPLPLQVLDLVDEVLGGDEPAQKTPARQRKGGNEQQ